VSDCHSCGFSNYADSKFCTECGRNLAATDVNLDTPEAITQYSSILKDFLVDARLEDWEEEELKKLRVELGISQDAHDDLLSRSGGSVDEEIPIRVFIDETAINKFIRDGNCLFNFLVANVSERVLRTVNIEFEDGERLTPHSLTNKAIGPGLAVALNSSITLTQAGAHILRSIICVGNTKGELRYFESNPLTFYIANPSAGQTTVTNIDVSSARVADLSSINLGSGSTATPSGISQDSSWIELELLRTTTGSLTHAAPKKTQAVSTSVEVNEPVENQVSILTPNAIDHSAIIHSDKAVAAVLTHEFIQSLLTELNTVPVGYTFIISSPDSSNNYYIKGLLQIENTIKFHLEAVGPENAEVSAAAIEKLKSMGWILEKGENFKRTPLANPKEVSRYIVDAFSVYGITNGSPITYQFFGADAETSPEEVSRHVDEAQATGNAEEPEFYVYDFLLPFDHESELYIADQIPEKKLRNARKVHEKKTNLPEDEEIVGLIDTSAFGSAKKSIIFTPNCVSGINPIDSWGFFYIELAKYGEGDISIKKEDSLSYILIGATTIYPGSGEDCAKLLKDILISIGAGFRQFAHHYVNSNVEDSHFLSEIQNLVGELYLHGIGVNEDYAEALKWFQMVSEKSDDAQLSLGRMYAAGWGVPINDAEAVEWFHRSANAGNKHAQCIIGLRYLEGRGVRPDSNSAKKWLQKAAEQGHPDAIAELEHLSD